jgi:DNA-damage-inducible protein D
MLKKRGVTPEYLPPAEDIKKVKRKLDIDEKMVLKELRN